MPPNTPNDNPGDGRGRIICIPLSFGAPEQQRGAATMPLCAAVRAALATRMMQRNSGPQAQTSTIGQVERVDEHTVRAQTCLFTNRGYSPQFVHGADMLMPLGNLVEQQLLQNNDVMAGIEHMRFREVTSNELDLTASFEQLPTAARKGSILEAQIATRQGRMVYVRGTPTTVPVRQMSEANPLARESMCLCANCATHDVQARSVRVQLKRPPLYEALAHTHTGLLACTVLDQVNTAVCELKRTGCIQTAGMALHVGVDNLRLPSQEFLLQPGNVLEVAASHSRPGLAEGKAMLQRIVATYRDAQGNEQGGGTFLYALGAPSSPAA